MAWDRVVLLARCGDASNLYCSLTNTRSAKVSVRCELGRRLRSVAFRRPSAKGLHKRSLAGNDKTCPRDALEYSG